MATATLPLETEQPTRLLTVADVAALPSELPSGAVRYELDDGRLIIMPPAGDLHGAVELKIGTEVNIQGERQGHGKARCGDVGVILWRDPDRLVGMDIAFIANQSLPIRLSIEGYLETIPDLGVEVRSKNDTLAACARKIEDYLTAGVKVVWLADPFARTITVFRRDMPPQVLTENDILTVEDIIPGFQVAVKDIFQE